MALTVGLFYKPQLTEINQPTYATFTYKNISVVTNKLFSISLYRNIIIVYSFRTTDRACANRNAPQYWLTYGTFHSHFLFNFKVVLS